MDKGLAMAKMRATRWRRSAATCFSRSTGALAMLASFALACSQGGGPARQVDATRSPGGSPAPQPTAPAEEGRAYPCKSDSDCPSLACGPCTPGEVITDQAMKECVANPCLDASAVCGPNGVCVVNAKARKNPEVWCRACFDLEFDKAKLCAKPTSDAGVAECQKTIDDTARTCDQEKCAKARQTIEDDQSPLRLVEERRRQLEQEQLKRYNETKDWFDKSAKH